MKHFLLLVETGKLSLEQMFEAIRLSGNDSDVAQAVVEKIDWGKLSPEQMFKAIKLSNNNPDVAQAVVETLQ